MRVVSVGILFFVMLTVYSEAIAQLSLERQVLSCSGMMYTGSVQVVSATVGQTEYSTITMSAGILTQGFQQPGDVAPMIVTFEVFASECSNLYEVRILSIDGCEDMSGVAISWNGIPGGMIQSDLPSETTLSITTLSGCHYFRLYNFAEYPDKISISCDLEFYNYISPNNDGDNDVWIIKNINSGNVHSSEVKIFNRWGISVWEGNNYDNVNVVWDGKSQSGELLPDGTYYYVANIDGKIYNGYVELVR